MKADSMVKNVRKCLYAKQAYASKYPVTDQFVRYVSISQLEDIHVRRRIPLLIENMKGMEK